MDRASGAGFCVRLTDAPGAGGSGPAPGGGMGRGQTGPGRNGAQSGERRPGRARAWPRAERGEAAPRAGGAGGGWGASPRAGESSPAPRGRGRASGQPGPARARALCRLPPGGPARPLRRRVCAASGAARVECSPGSRNHSACACALNPARRGGARLLSSMPDRPARKRRRARPFITIEGFEGFCVRLTGGECGAPSANRLGCAPRNNRRARPHTASCRRR